MRNISYFLTSIKLVFLQAMNHWEWGRGLVMVGLGTRVLFPGSLETPILWETESPEPLVILGSKFLHFTQEGCCGLGLLGRAVLIVFSLLCLTSSTFSPIVGVFWGPTVRTKGGWGPSWGWRRGSWGRLVFLLLISILFLFFLQAMTSKRKRQIKQGLTLI